MDDDLEFARESEQQLKTILADLVELAMHPANSQERQKALIHGAQIVDGDQHAFLETLTKLPDASDRGYGHIYAARIIEAAFMIGSTAEPTLALRLVAKLEDESRRPKKPRSKTVRIKMISALQALYDGDPRAKGFSRDEILRAVEARTGSLGPGDKRPSLARALDDLWPSA